MPSKYYTEHRDELLPKLRENAKRYYAANREKVIARVLSRYVPTGRPRGRPKKNILKTDNEVSPAIPVISGDEPTHCD